MIGQTILHYKIIEKLGEGGMGVVYRAEDTSLHRTVALKFLPEKASGSDQDKDRFLREARAAATLNHPNICTIHAIEQFDGRYFIAMEYVDGVTLNEKIPFKMPNAAFDAAIQIGDALSEAHAHGIVHRDVKAENIMITPKGQVKVMDFGLAKLKGSLKLTRTSSTVGTLGYMSPEQIQGGEVDHRSDIFSLGVLLFEMIAGQLPFRGEHEAAMVYSIANEEPKNLSDLVPSAPAGLGDILAKALEKDPNERYQSAADFAVDLKRLKKQSSASARSGVRPASGSRSSTAAMPAGGGAPAWSSGDREQHDDTPNRGRTPVVILAVFLAVSLLYTTYLQFIAGGPEAGSGMRFTQVTEMAGEELQPAISPDGNYVVFVKTAGGEADIFHMRIGGGNPINLTEGSGTYNFQPAFSPQGDLIAFRSERDGGGIFLMGSTGESVRRLTKEGYNPSWSPDGEHIVYASESINHPFARQTVSSLWIVDVRDGSRTKLYDGDGVQPRWSPDGARIIFWALPTGTGQRELFEIPAGGGTPVRLTDDDAIDWNPVWSADGKKIYFLSDRGGTMNVWTMAASGGTPSPMTVPALNCTWLSVSPDGKRLLYLATELRGNIYRNALDTKTMTLRGPASPVTEGSKVFKWLSVSPDGGSLTCSIVGVREDVGVMRVDGTGFRKLTNDAAKDRGPRWSPDGKKIAFYSTRGGTYQIWMVNADGSGFQQITDDPKGVIYFPVWAPDGAGFYGTQDSILQYVEVEGGKFPVKPKILPPYREVGTVYPSSVRADGKVVACGVTLPDGSYGGIVLYDVGKSTYRKVLDDGWNPFWLADNRRILFIKDQQLSVLDTETGIVGPIEGVPPLDDDNPFSLSPDNSVLFYIKKEAESDIWQASLE